MLGGHLFLLIKGIIFTRFPKRDLQSRHPDLNRELSNDDGNGIENVTWKAISSCFKLALAPFYTICFMFWSFPGVDSIGQYLNSEKRKSGCLVFTLSIRRETGRFHVVEVQRGQRIVQKA